MLSQVLRLTFIICQYKYVNNIKKTFPKVSGWAIFLFVYFHRLSFLWPSAMTGIYFKGTSKVFIINVFSKGNVNCQ